MSNNVDVGMIQADVQRFLEKVTTHPRLSQSLVVQAFVQGTDIERVRRRKRGIAAQLKRLAPGSQVVEHDEVFLQRKDQIQQLTTTVRACQKASDTLFDERRRTKSCTLQGRFLTHC